MMPGMMGPGMMAPGLMMGELPFPEMRDGGANPAFFGSKIPKEQSIFYKTRPCLRFKEGRCTFGDRCSYAHGEAELRKLPPEGEQIRARMAQEGGRTDMQPNPPAAKPEAGHKGEHGRGAAIKTRMCMRFIQSGQCNYGSDCKFAHGFEELQGGDGGPRMPMDAAGFDPFRAGMLMPGGPMLPPDFMMNGMMGMGGPIMPPRPPPGPAPPALPHPGDALDSRQTPNHSPVYDLGMFPQRTSSESVASVPYKERIQAFCSIMGVGADQVKDIKPEAIEAAIASVHSGEAFFGTAYSDTLDMAQ